MSSVFLSDKFDGAKNAEIVNFIIDNPKNLPTVADIQNRIERQLAWNSNSKIFKVENLCAVNKRPLIKESIYYGILPYGSNRYEISVYFDMKGTILRRVFGITMLLLAFFTYGISLLVYLIPMVFVVVKSQKKLYHICESIVGAVNGYNDEINKTVNNDKDSQQKPKTLEERLYEMKDKLSQSGGNSVDGKDGYKIAEDGTIIRN
jgi:hypothetical protein